jgi:hypothetical protein
VLRICGVCVLNNSLRNVILHVARVLTHNNQLNRVFVFRSCVWSILWLINIQRTTTQIFSLHWRRFTSDKNRAA